MTSSFDDVDLIGDRYTYKLVQQDGAVVMHLPCLMEEAIRLGQLSAEGETMPDDMRHLYGLREAFYVDGKWLWYGHIGVDLSRIVVATGYPAESARNKNDLYARMGVSIDSGDTHCSAVLLRLRDSDKTLLVPFYGNLLRARCVRRLMTPVKNLHFMFGVALNLRVATNVVFRVLAPYEFAELWRKTSEE